MNFIKQLFPIATWLPGYQKKDLNGDLFAGLTVGVMLIPQGMAYALIAGLPPVYGLYASIIPQIIYAIFGTSRQMSVASSAMDSLLVAAGVSVMATEGTESYISLAIMLAFFMGLFQLLLGVFRLGFITNLLSKPVISGFTTAAALIIGLNQIKYLLGTEVSRSARFYDLLVGAFNSLNQTHLITLLIGIAGIIIIVGLKKLHNRIPGALIAVVLGILVVYIWSLNEQGVAIVAEIPEGLPSFKIPDITLEKFIKMAPLAFTIAIVAFMESFSVAKAIEMKKKTYKIIPNQELIALGMANFIGSLFQSYPVAGGFSRSAVNDQAGANTPLASFISAALVAITLIFLTPLFYYLPKAILASVIMVAASSLVDIKYMKELFMQSKVELVLLVLTLLVTINFGMIEGLVTGIIISILLLLYKAAYPHIAELGRLKGYPEYRNIERFKELEQWPDILIIRVDAPLTFINIQYVSDFMENKIRRSAGKITTVILDAGPVSHLDVTAAQGLNDLIEDLKGREIIFFMCDMTGPVRDIAHRSGLMKTLGHDHVFIDIEEAMRFINTQSEGKYKNYALQSND